MIEQEHISAEWIAAVEGLFSLLDVNHSGYIGIDGLHSGCPKALFLRAQRPTCCALPMAHHCLLYLLCRDRQQRS